MRLNEFEARYTSIHTAFMKHPTPDNQLALQDIGDEYEAEIQKCWDKGLYPVWHKLEETYKLE